jgi:protein-disulfide isomerase
VYTQTRARSVSTVSRTPTRIAEWEQIVGRATPLDSLVGPVQLVAFSDYQCPACRTIHATIDALVEAHSGTLDVRHMHFPLVARHAEAMNAAIAAECSRLQGRFREYHGALFREVGWPGSVSWDSLATIAEVTNRARFKSCIEGRETEARVRHDIALANRIGVIGTPMFALDGWFQGNLTPPELVALVDSAARVARMREGQAPGMGVVKSETSPVLPL